MYCNMLVTAWRVIPPFPHVITKSYNKPGCYVVVRSACGSPGRRKDWTLRTSCGLATATHPHKVCPRSSISRLPSSRSSRTSAWRRPTPSPASAPWTAGCSAAWLTTRTSSRGTCVLDLCSLCFMIFREVYDLTWPFMTLTFFARSRIILRFAKPLMTFSSMWAKVM